MAWVYSAWDQRLRVPRAIKLLKPEFAQRRKLRQRFESEAHTMARLEHPHVVRVYDVGEQDGTAWIAMELADGGSLSDWIDAHGPMPPELAVRVVVEMCEGIGAAHDLAIIHRDIKPHNVLVDRRGTCKVTDFGIARLESASFTRTGAVMGTLGYMAPEQRVNAKDVDRRADIYSLGATLWALLRGDQPGDLFMAATEPEHLVGIEADLGDVITKACRYKREQRYKDCPELVRALARTQAFLRPLPPDVPSLVVFTKGSSELKAPSNPTLAEIRGETPRPPPGATLLPPPAATAGPTLGPAASLPPSDRTSKPLYVEEEPSPSYRMPTPEPASDATPSWVVQEPRERPPSRQDFNIGPSFVSEGHHDTVDEDEEGGVLSEEQKETLLTASRSVGDAVGFAVQVIGSALKVIWKPLSAFAIPVLGICAIGASQVMAGASQIKANELVAVEKRQVLYSVLTKEVGVLEDLQEAGQDTEALATLYDSFEEGAGDERLVAALRYASQVGISVDASVQTAEPELEHKVQLARRRLERINNARHAYTAAMVDWEEAADSRRGSIAVSLGMAEPPP